MLHDLETALARADRLDEPRPLRESLRVMLGWLRAFTRRLRGQDV